MEEKRRGRHARQPQRVQVCPSSQFATNLCVAMTDPLHFGSSYKSCSLALRQSLSVSFVLQTGKEHLRSDQGPAEALARDVCRGSEAARDPTLGAAGANRGAATQGAQGACAEGGTTRAGEHLPQRLHPLR